MQTGHIKKVFPGGNTAEGFYSFYDYVISNDAKRLFILKGGPGVGKSTFMKYIGEQMLKRGYDLEYHYCSSANDSIDGVVVPKIGIAMIDGTAPHTIDPKNPGVVDEMINLGEYWDESGLAKQRDAILRTSKEVSRCFRRAYGYLAQAKLLNEEIESYYLDSNSLDLGGLNNKALEIISEIFTERGNSPVPFHRHLFASGITPQGPCNYLDTIFDNLKKRYILVGEPGTGKSTLVEKVYRTAIQLGYDVEVYHCSLDPAQLEHLLIPQLGVGIITSTNYHTYPIKNAADTVIDTRNYIDEQALIPWQDDLIEAKNRFECAFDRAIHYISRAKTTHDVLEDYYVPNMKFTAINEVRHGILQRILTYALEL